MRLFIESDFAAGRAMRLRHAFQTDHFVVGQTWSTFSDPEAEPIGIDFEGLSRPSRGSGNRDFAGRRAERGR